MKLKPTRVVLADDHAMVRESLARVLQESGSVSVTGQARDGLQLLEIVREQQPDCVVLDYSMPGLDAPAVIEQLTTKYKSLKILVLTVHENVHYAVRALEAGAHGYMIKSAAVDELVEAIAAVCGGEVYLSPNVSRRLVATPPTEAGATGPRIAVAAGVRCPANPGSGASLQQCAEQLQVTTSTISTYRSRILEKLQLSGTAELIRFAIEHRIQG